jgi:serine/threonine-protein kinase
VAKLGKYEIIEELGRGAMGVVYKAKDPLIGRLVALKTITSSLAEQPEMLERFYREAQAAGGLAHPNIVTIFDLGEEQKTPFIAMEFLEGISIEKIIEENHPLPMSQRIGYIVQVSRALDYAHKRGVVHRDIKPANIVVTKDDTIKVVDFGIARLVDTSRSQTGLLIGTVNYMSPEQVRGERVDGRSDIFSVGVMFYELLSGQRPFSGANFTAVMLAIISQEFKPVSTLVEHIPPELDAFFVKILKKDINERYQTMEEALLDLEPIHRKLQVEAVAGMLKRTEQLIQEKKLEEARDVLRQALLVDSTNHQAKTLLDKVNTELKRSLVTPKAQEHVSKAKQLLEQGKIPEAQAEVDAALKLDSVYEPAQEILKQVQKEADKAKKARDFLKAAQQQMAEGNLTEAQQQVGKLLEMDSKNAQAQKLLKQITEEKERREKRQHLLDTMQQARSLWTQQKYDDCIKVLDGLKKEFPGEDEIDKLLETVRTDQEDQNKHEKLSEARRLLGEQHFAESLAILDKLLERSPDETTIQKLRDMVVKERKDHAQRVRLQHEQQALKKLVNEENYKEVINKGEQLMKEFPNDFELTRLVEFARTQNAQVEQQRKLKEKLDELQALMKNGEFEKAVTAAEKALEAFPGNMDFTRILDDARTKQKDKEKKEYVEKQIRSIKTAIDKGNLTDAIDLGRQTLSIAKNDTDVTRLVQFAEREKDMRSKKQDTDQQLKTAVFLMESKKFDEATEVLENVQKTVVFDPRVHSLLEAAKHKQVPTNLDQTIAGVAGVTKEQEYVLQTPGGPAVAPTDEGVVAKAQATPGVEPTPKAPPMPVAPPPEKEKKAAPAPEPIPPPPVKPPDKKKGMPAVEEPVKAKPAVEPPAPPKSAPPPPPPQKPAVEPPKAKPAFEPQPPAKAKPAVEPPPPPKPAPAPAPPKVEPAKAKPAVEPSRAAAAPSVAVPVEEKKSFLASPAGMAVIGVVVVALAVGGYFMFSGTSTDSGTGTPGITGTTTPGGGTAAKTPDQVQLEMKDEANKLFDSGNTTAAVAKIDDALKVEGGTRSSELQALKRTFMDAAANAKVLGEEKKLYDQAESAFGRGKFDDAERDFKKILGLKGGRRQADAQRYISDLIPARKQEEKYITDAKRLAGSNNPADLQNAKGMLETVAKGGGSRKQEAQNLLTQVQTKLDSLGKEELLKGAMTAGRDALRRGDYGAARRSADDIKSQGSDPTALLNEISSAEQTKLGQLQSQFNSLRGSKNKSGLANLQGEARRFAEASGNQNARTLADNEIPGAIRTIDEEEARANEGRVAGQQKTEFDSAVNAFNGARTRDALNRARDMFEKIVQGGGPYVQQAQDYVNNKIPAQARAITPCPPIVVSSAAAGLGGSVKEGQIVAAGLLDTKPTWVSCQMPDFSGTGVARVSMEIDEQGNITNVKPRGNQPSQELFNAIAAAAKNWKVTPPRAKGLAVKTELSMDFKF